MFKYIICYIVVTILTRIIYVNTSCLNNRQFTYLLLLLCITYMIEMHYFTRVYTYIYTYSNFTLNNMRPTEHMSFIYIKTYTDHHKHGCLI